jgi:hypothetical protein
MAAGTLAPPDDSSNQIQAADPSNLVAPIPQGTQAAPAAPGAPAAPLDPNAPAQPNDITNGKKGVVATPTVVPQYDPKKLAKANTTLDLLNAMKPQSRTDYMDWWEKQHGDIDDKYDALKAKIGARPSDDEPQNKKEKFAALLEFGLHLMKASAAPSKTQGAVLSSTLSDSVDQAGAAHAQNIAGQQKAYDANSNAIEEQRDAELKGIGTPAQAQAAQSTQNKNYASETKDNATAFKDLSDATTTKASSLGAPVYATDPTGTLHSVVRQDDGTAKASPVLGIDGKPFQGKVLGRESGSGIDKSAQDTAAIRNQKYLTGVLGIDAGTAAQVAFKPKTGNPTSDHLAVYKSVMGASMGDEDKAKRAADQYVLENYGAGAIPKQNAPLTSGGGTPPPEALAGLKSGQARTLRAPDGTLSQWTLGIDGKPVRVGNGPSAIQ